MSIIVLTSKPNITDSQKKLPEGLKKMNGGRGAAREMSAVGRKGAREETRDARLSHMHTYPWSLGPVLSQSGQQALGASHQPIWRGLALWPMRSAGLFLTGAHSALPASQRLDTWSLA